jgi:alkyl hydroperoxide reductase subunit AhpC
VAQLCRHEETLKKLNAEVLLVSFGSGEYARIWQQETCAPFRLLLDPQRAVYKTYGLQRSLRRSWNWQTLRRYADLLLSGRRWRGIQGDSTQLGGDFVIDASGIVRFAYLSHDPTDRPPVPNLIHVLEHVSGKDAP